MLIILICFLVLIMVSVIVYNFSYSIELKLKTVKLEKLFKRKEVKISKKNISDNFIKLITPITKSSNPIIVNYRNLIEQKINIAGNPQGLDFNTIVSIQILVFVFSLILSVLIFETINIIILLLCFILSSGIPILWLNNQIQTRQKNILRNLPDALDLLVLTMEAGLDFSMALNKYIEKGEKGPLRDEFFIVQQEIKMGKTRIEALNSLSERLKIPAVETVINSLVQGLQLGSSLTPILKIQSQQLRIQRFQMAEKLAAEAPTKMLFPLLFFIFPTVFIVLFVPIILSFLKG